MQIRLLLQVVEFCQHLPATIDASHCCAFGRADVADTEVVGVGVFKHFERAVFETQDSGRSTSEPLINLAAQLHERRQCGLEAFDVTDDGSVRRVSERRIESATGHDELISCAVAAVLRIPAAKHSESVQLFGKCRHDLGELNSRHGRVDHAKLAPDTDRSFRFRINSIMMTGSTSCPDQDAVDVFR